MIITNKIYVLQSNENPITFLNLESLLPCKFEYKPSISIEEAQKFSDVIAAEIVLENYNKAKLQGIISCFDSPNYHIVPLRVTYEF